MRTTGRWVASAKLDGAAHPMAGACRSWREAHVVRDFKKRNIMVRHKLQRFLHRAGTYPGSAQVSALGVRVDAEDEVVLRFSTAFALNAMPNSHSTSGR